MSESGEYQCPWCGQSGTAVVDSGITFQRFITDCEVCCRPIEIVVECAEGEILSLDARPG